jgi:ribose 5-phosphate isomerase
MCAGIVEHGLFIAMANVVLIAKGSEVQELRGGGAIDR